MSAYGLHSGSTTMDFVHAINTMATEAARYQLRIADIEAKLLAVGGERDEKKKEWRESKAYQGWRSGTGARSSLPIGSSNCSAS